MAEFNWDEFFNVEVEEDEEFEQRSRARAEKRIQTMEREWARDDRDRKPLSAPEATGPYGHYYG